MAVPALEDRTFILGVEEGWNKYFEVTVRFLKKVERAEHDDYYLFADETTGTNYWLTPRYKADAIPLAAVAQIMVNIEISAPAPDGVDVLPPPRFATGSLKPAAS